MSAIENSSDHLRAVAHPSSSCYNIRSSNNANNSSTIQASAARGSVRGSAVRGSAMGGMVSALTAVLCGSSKQETDEICCKNLPTSTVNGLVTKYSRINGASRLTSTTELARNTKVIEDKLQAITIKPHMLPQDSTYDSDSEYCDASEGLITTHPGSPLPHEYLDIPYMDEDSDRSQLSVSEPNLIALEKESNKQDGTELMKTNTTEGRTRHEDVELIVLSEAEYSADEEQEEQVDENISDDEEELERVDSESEDELATEDRHICDSECEHSNEEMEDESDAASEDEEHECTSDCEHSEDENIANDLESEYESEVEGSDIEHQLVDITEEIIEISDNELSCDEEQESESGEELDCDSNCDSECDGNHHECSSQCGCELYESDSVHESQSDDEDNHGEEDLAKQLVNGAVSNVPLHPAIPEFPKANFPHQPIQSTTGLLGEISAQNNHSLKPIERNNNRVQRNHSQRQLYRSNTTDMMGELKTAIDARVRRSASCRETGMDYRNKYSHLNNLDIPENFSKLDLKEREMRRKERRTRLRTLELKREQCLDELRDGTEENITERVYRDTTQLGTT